MLDQHRNDGHDERGYDALVTMSERYAQMARPGRLAEIRAILTDLRNLAGEAEDEGSITAAEAETIAQLMLEWGV